MARAKLHDTEGFIYFVISGSGPIKIGFATNPITRLASMQVGNCDDLHLVVTVPGDRDLEAHYHKRFADRRIRGEWFEYCAPIMREIDHLLGWDKEAW